MKKEFIGYQPKDKLNVNKPPNMNYHDFAKKYVRIKDNNGNIYPFNKIQLDRINEIEDMMNKGYKLRFIYLRGRGVKLCLINK